MMKEQDLGPAPRDEPRARPQDPNYALRSEIECRVWLRQLRRTISVDPSVRARLTVRAQGGRRVVVHYDDDDAEANRVVERILAALPSRWDATAAAELRWFANHYHYLGLVARRRITYEQVPPKYRGPLPEPTDIVQGEAA